MPSPSRLRHQRAALALLPAPSPRQKVAAALRRNPKNRLFQRARRHSPARTLPRPVSTPERLPPSARDGVSGPQAVRASLQWPTPDQQKRRGGSSSLTTASPRRRRLRQWHRHYKRVPTGAANGYYGRIQPRDNASQQQLEQHEQQKQWETNLSFSVEVPEKPCATPPRLPSCIAGLMVVGIKVGTAKQFTNASSSCRIAPPASGCHDVAVVAVVAAAPLSNSAAKLLPGRLRLPPSTLHRRDALGDRRPARESLRRPC